jgi:hypothetical protein
MGLGWSEQTVANRDDLHMHNNWVSLCCVLEQAVHIFEMVSDNHNVTQSKESCSIHPTYFWFAIVSEGI